MKICKDVTLNISKSLRIEFNVFSISSEGYFLSFCRGIQFFTHGPQISEVCKRFTSEI